MARDNKAGTILGFLVGIGTGAAAVPAGAAGRR
jgi:hypothetical protein